MGHGTRLAGVFQFKDFFLQDLDEKKNLFNSKRREAIPFWKSCQYDGVHNLRFGTKQNPFDSETKENYQYNHITFKLKWNSNLFLCDFNVNLCFELSVTWLYIGYLNILEHKTGRTQDWNPCNFCW